jgi:hypothetical protein
MFPCAFRVWGSWGGGYGGNRSCHVLSMKGERAKEEVATCFQSKGEMGK